MLLAHLYIAPMLCCMPRAQGGGRDRNHLRLYMCLVIAFWLALTCNKCNTADSRSSCRP
jgi:hypothetical protein